LYSHQQKMATTLPTQKPKPLQILIVSKTNFSHCTTNRCRSSMHGTHLPGPATDTEQAACTGGLEENQ
jgi:hypothetical protein